MMSVQAALIKCHSYINNRNSLLMILKGSLRSGARIVG